MSRFIVLDTGPIGLITNPKLSEQSVACNRWLQAHLREDSPVLLPEIADYEVCRELLRANKLKGLNRLDNLANVIDYMPLTTTAMHQAAQLGAEYL